MPTVSCIDAPEQSCCPGSGGSFVPALPIAEESLQTVGSAIYLLILLWIFMGVNIVSDYFMTAIEVITSQEKDIKVHDPKTGESRKFRLKTWNDTVANLTLMALGSSAPEILLSVIELIGNDWYTGELGANTIVGSAAFNLFVISGLCINAIPSGESRIILGTKVYACTASFSIFAYVWLYLVLAIISPNIVEIWEAVVTFMFFPLLVLLAYALDKDLLFKKKKQSSERALEYDFGIGAIPQQKVVEMRKKLKDVYGDLSEEKMMQLVANEIEKTQRKSRAHYRVMAARELNGGKKNHSLEERRKMNGHVVPVSISPEAGPSATECGWVSTSYSVLEKGEPDENSESGGTGYVTVTVIRSATGFPASVYFATMPGDGAPDPKTGKPRGIAKATEDYEHKEGWVEFAADDAEAHIQIKIVDDDSFEQDEDFYVVLKEVKCENGHAMKISEEHSKTCITIIDDDEPGQLQFTKDEYFCVEGEDKYAVCEVQRVNGSSGKITCEFNTQDVTAKAGADYTETTGTLTFDKGVTVQEIKIPIIDDEAIEKKEKFRVIIHSATGGAKFTESTDGGFENGLCDVYITNNPKSVENVNKILAFYQEQAESNKIASSNWAEQFTGAIYVNGSKEEQAESSWADVFFHIISVPWKILFAFIPPAEFFGGKLCFVISLVAIGSVTAIIGDVAAMLGCAAGIRDNITAITIVALGTSLPDTFASMAAATMDEYADNSIGNVTGSNSVNVFLGLGIQWCVGALYWHLNYEAQKENWENRMFQGETYKDAGYVDQSFDQRSGTVIGRFVYPAGELGFSVAVFSTLACFCVAFLALRRNLFGAELGGPDGPKKASTLVCVSFWVLYLVLSIMQTYKMI
jgi:solute carrier family 8 (sodium/calcium exchanger)